MKPTNWRTIITAMKNNGYKEEQIIFMNKEQRKNTINTHKSRNIQKGAAFTYTRNFIHKLRNLFKHTTIK
jgi:hypothetical protein